MAGVTAARNSFGASLYYGGTPTLLAKVTKITPNKRTVGVIDSSHHGSTFAEKISDSLIDGGKISFEATYLSASLTAIDALVGVSTAYKVVFPGGDFVTFSAILTSFGIDDLPVKGALMTCSGEMEITTALTWTMA